MVNCCNYLSVNFQVLNSILTNEIWSGIESNLERLIKFNYSILYPPFINVKRQEIKLKRVKGFTACGNTYENGIIEELENRNFLLNFTYV